MDEQCNFHGSVVSVKSAVSYSKLSPAACECCNNYWHQTDTEQYSKGCSLIFPWMNFYFYFLVFDCTFYKMKLTEKLSHNIVHKCWSLHTFWLLYNQINCFKFNWYTQKTEKLCFLFQFNLSTKAKKKKLSIGFGNNNKLTHLNWIWQNTQKALYKTQA